MRKILLSLVLACGLASNVLAAPQPKFLLPADVTVTFSITGDTQFSVTAPALSARYKLQASNGNGWFDTGFVFGAADDFKSVYFSVYGTADLSFRLMKF